MVDWLIDPFTGGIMRRALAEVLVLGIACGPLGVWVLLYRQSFAAESLAHGMLPGLVIAALIGAPLLWGAVGGVLAAAIAVGAAGRDARLGPDVGVAVAIGALTGLGALLALAPDVPPRLIELLFGDPLGATRGEVVRSAVVVLGILVVLAATHRRLTVGAFDTAAAASLGVSARRSELILLVVLGATTVAVVGALGTLLTLALILAPAAAALRSARRLPAAMALAGGLAAAAGVAGLLVSYHLEVATGASIALAAVAAWAVTMVLPTRSGGATT